MHRLLSDTQKQLLLTSRGSLRQVCRPEAKLCGNFQSTQRRDQASTPFESASGLTVVNIRLEWRTSRLAARAAWRGRCRESERVLRRTTEQSRRQSCPAQSRSESHKVDSVSG